ncbi:hypothetical protein GWI33_021669 [Rhynchophorus ferrugineus]|uniref:Uncharacterized protein n=1 Tax=Rhynchophorus ferrugineus TaxID=354439 RepID=A0A834HQC2_RHYFE|nr:hypothetical protein GWI33_021669 [Rhynchophorus ferrugineus]
MFKVRDVRPPWEWSPGKSPTPPSRPAAATIQAAWDPNTPGKAHRHPKCSAYHRTVARSPTRREKILFFDEKKFPVHSNRCRPGGEESELRFYTGSFRTAHAPLPFNHLVLF